MTNDNNKSEREQYKLIKDAYITKYIYDKDTDIVYITLASDKKITIRNPSDVILTKIKSVYNNTGAKLKAANKILTQNKWKGDKYEKDETRYV